MKYEKWIFPGLQDWFLKNRQTEVRFAAKIGVDNNTLSRWMRGKTEIPLFGVKAILKETEMTFEEAFGEKEKPLRDDSPESGKHIYHQ